MENVENQPHTFTRILCFVALIALSTGIYLQTTGFQFLLVDDPAYIIDNAQVRAGLTADSVRWAFTDSVLGHWHPVTFLSYMLDMSLYGLKPGGFHFTNMLLHIANALLLWAALYALTGAYLRSWLVALLFAVHPLHVESVAWVAERKDVLSTFFALIALYFYADYAKRPRVWPYLGVVVAFALGLMSKAMVVTLPCVLLLLDYWPLERLETDRAIPVRERLRCWGLLIAEKVPLFLLAAGASYMTIWASVQDHAVRDTVQLSVPYRLANACFSYAQYLTKTVWPVNLAAFYPHLGADLSTVQIVASVVVLVGFTAAALAGARRYPYGIVGWLWFLGMIVPVSGLFQVGDQAMADRYTYLALTGVFIWAVWGIADGIRPRGFTRWAVGAVTAGIVAGFTIVAWQHTFRWRNTVALYEYSLVVTPDNTFARQVLGHTYLLQNDPETAAVHYEAALAMSPGHPEWTNMLGYAYLQQGRHEEAAEMFEQVLTERPDHADSLNGLGVVQLEQKNYAEAKATFERLVALRPDAEGPLVNLAIALALDGASADAEPVFLEALAIDPDSVRAHVNLAALYLKLGRYEEALDHAERALDLDPDNVQAAEHREEASQRIAAM